VLDAYLRDTVRAWLLRSDGEYERIVDEKGPGFSAQHYLLSHLPPYGADR
jgi:polyphosphate kinase